MENYVQGDFEKVYLVDDKPCNIISKGDMTFRLSNGATWKLNNVRHVPHLNRNLIVVSKLASVDTLLLFPMMLRKLSRELWC